MKNSLYLCIAVMLCALVQSSYAGIIGDVVTGTTSGIPDFTLNDQTIRESIGSLDYEFITSVQPMGMSPIRVSFDFENNFLYISISNQSGFAVAPDFSVTFTSLDWTSPDDTLLSTRVTNDNAPSGVSEQGFTHAVLDDGDGLLLTFTGLALRDSRSIDLRLITLLQPDTGDPSVVPVPAAAPMALLGLGALALARRFRRKTS